MPTVKNQRRRNKSLCEKSTQIALNITKLSSLYLARLTLGSQRPAKSLPAQISSPAPEPAQDPKAQKVIEPENSLASSFVMEPNRGGGVDDQAAQFISRFRERNQQSDPGIHKEVSKCIPPPPRVKWANY